MLTLLLLCSARCVCTRRLKGTVIAEFHSALRSAVGERRSPEPSSGSSLETTSTCLHRKHSIRLRVVHYYYIVISIACGCCLFKKVALSVHGKAHTSSTTVKCLDIPSAEHYTVRLSRPRTICQKFCKTDSCIMIIKSND